jgi:flagellar protein FlaG
MDFFYWRIKMSSINTSSVAQSGMPQTTGFVDQNTKPAPKVESSIDTAVVAKAIESSKFIPSDVVKASAPTREVVAKAAEQIQSFVKSMGRDLSFSVDQTTGYHVVRVVDPNTGELVRQLPSKELLDIARSMADLHNGLVSQKA